MFQLTPMRKSKTAESLGGETMTDVPLEMPDDAHQIRAYMMQVKPELAALKAPSKGGDAVAYWTGWCDVVVQLKTGKLGVPRHQAEQCAKRFERSRDPKVKLAAKSIRAHLMIFYSADALFRDVALTLEPRFFGTT